MSESGTAAPPAGVVVTDHQIAEELESLLRDTNSFTSLNVVVQRLESKLGVNLSHRIDFISTQIQHFLRQAQLQNFIPQHHQPDHFSIHQTPNLPAAPSPHPPPNFTAHRTAEAFGFSRPPPQPQPQLSHPNQTPPVAVKDPSAAAPSVSAKESAPAARKRRGGPGGLNKLCGVSPELQTIVGQPTLPRTEV